MWKAKLPPSKHEVLAAVGRRVGQRKKIVVVITYIPPYYNADQKRSLFKYMNDCILKIKSKYRYDDPYIICGGDFNRRDFRTSVAEYPEIKPVLTEPTRGNVVLDILASNFNESLTDSGVTESISNADGVRMDHLTVFASYRMPCVPSYSIQEYTYRHLTEEGHLRFGDWLKSVRWDGLLSEQEVNKIVPRLHRIFEDGLNHCYELKKRRKKSSEPAWMMDWIRKEIEAQRQIFRTDKCRSDRWKSVKNALSIKITKRRKKQDQNVLDKFKSETNAGKFFHHIACLLGKNSGPRWSPEQLYPGQSKEEVANNLAAFFNQISSQYEPLKPEEIPTTTLRTLPVITQQMVEEKLKAAKKPTSTVPGDIPAILYSRYPRELSPIITHLFIRITVQQCWPDDWKIEYITVIYNDQQYPSECRNIACTNFLSKLYEAFVLQWSREEVRPKMNQYGGEPGASSTQLLIEVISDVTAAMEDNRAGVVLSPLDFSKAFNRLDHLKCLQAFEKKGSSTEILSLLGSFLSGRRMTIRVGEAKSSLLPVNAGAPQGSVLGCYLLNVGVDDLEEGLNEEEQRSDQAEAHKETLVRTDDFPAVSTPARAGSRRADILESPVQAAGHNSFAILPQVANVPHWIPRPKNPIFHDSPLNTLKYVDDQVNTSVVNMRKAKLLVEEVEFFKEIIDKRTKCLLFFQSC